VTTGRSTAVGRLLPAILVAGAAGWVTFALLIGGMMARTPPGAGFDLELLLTGGRRVASGLSPYEPSMLAGQSVGITTLFFSYPPLVAQALSPLASVPPLLVLAVLLVAGPLAGAGASMLIVRRYGLALPDDRAFLIALALLPFWFPFTLAMLFGNLDTLFVALYGLILLSAILPAPSRRMAWAAGAALALASVTKLHPAVLGVWLLARGVREWRRGEPRLAMLGLALPRSWATAAASAVVVLAILAGSLLAGGPGPWADYLTVLRASTVVDLLDPRNLGPAVQVALLFGLGSGSLAALQAVIVGVALVVAVVAALVVEDPLESLLWATFASLVPLPVTWFHHFAVLFPFGVAALARAWATSGVSRRGVAGQMGLAVAIGAIGFGTAVAWLFVPVFLVGTRLSRGPAAG
jgi:Glycosyltransferase family 87